VSVKSSAFLDTRPIFDLESVNRDNAWRELTAAVESAGLTTLPPQAPRARVPVQCRYRFSVAIPHTRLSSPGQTVPVVDWHRFPCPRRHRYMQSGTPCPGNRKHRGIPQVGNSGRLVVGDDELPEKLLQPPPREGPYQS
jgi:hypothetical protein